MSVLADPSIVLLDSGPLGLITNPKASAEAVACKTWQRSLVLAGHVVLMPEIVDYEHRRELVLAGLAKAEQALDAWKATGFYLPLTTAAMLQAARFWAEARRAGLPTADRFALDGDAILAAQAVTLDTGFWGLPGANVVVATMNVGHLTRFTAAEEWRDIEP